VRPAVCPMGIFATVETGSSLSHKLLGVGREMYRFLSFRLPGHCALNRVSLADKVPNLLRVSNFFERRNCPAEDQSREENLVEVSN